MQGTQIKQRESFYERLLREDQNSKANDNYKNILSSLRMLIDKTNKLDPKKGNMTAKDLTDMMQLYVNIYKMCDEHVANAKSPFEVSRNDIVKELKRVLAMDMRVFNKMNKDNPGNYYDAVKEARIIKVDATGKQLGSKGGSVSSRIPMKFNKQKGFFTKRSSYSAEAHAKALVKKQEQLLPKKCLSSLRRLETDAAFRNKFLVAFENGEIGNVLKMIGYSDNEIRYRDQEIDGLSNTRETERHYSENVQQMNSFLDDVQLFSNQVYCNETQTGIKNGRRLDQRNAASTSIARLMGCDNLLASAVPMEMIDGDKKIQGTFMNMAEGEDILNVSRNSPFSKCNRSSVFSQPEFYKQLADLQALDYICGNTDRHEGNMFYKFNTENPPKIIGIMGIDNDLSFGTNTFDDKEVEKGVIHPEKMKHISEKTANKIMAISEEMLRTMLMEYDLTKEEIDAAWKRTQNIQSAIQNKKITIVKDGEWGLAVSQAKNNYGLKNLYARVTESLDNHLDGIWDKIKERETKDTSTEYSKMEGDQMRLDVKGRAIELKEKMNIFRKLDYHFGSKAFNAMRNDLKKLSDAYEQLDKKYAEKTPDADDWSKLAQLSDKLAESTKNYIIAKKLQPVTEHGRAKLEVAKALQDIILENNSLQEQILEFKKEPEEIEVGNEK